MFWCVFLCFNMWNGNLMNSRCRPWTLVVVPFKVLWIWPLLPVFQIGIRQPKFGKEFWYCLFHSDLICAQSFKCSIPSSNQLRCWIVLTRHLTRVELYCCNFRLQIVYRIDHQSDKMELKVAKIFQRLSKKLTRTFKNYQIWSHCTVFTSRSFA